MACFVLVLAVALSTASQFPCNGIGDITAVDCDKGTCPGIAVCDETFDACCCGNTTLNCFVEPCKFAACSIPGAKCINEYCNGCCCEARFFLNNKDITDQCPTTMTS